MSCAQIRGYAEGWGRFQSRIHGGESSDSASEVEDVSEDEQEYLGSTLLAKMGLSHA